VAKREKIAGAWPLKRKVCGLTVSILVTFCLSMSFKSYFHGSFQDAMDAGLKLDNEINTPA